jgi:hypothetical protein
VSALATALAQVDLPGLGQKGPEALQRLLRVFGVLLGLGFLIAIGGHIFKSRVLVIVGVGLVLIATVVFMVAVGSYG